MSDAGAGKILAADSLGYMSPRYAPGALVQLAGGEISAVVSCAEWWGRDLWRYQVAWWANGERKVATVDAWEIE